MTMQGKGNNTAGNGRSLIEGTGDAIMKLREERRSILAKAALTHDLQVRADG